MGVISIIGPAGVGKSYLAQRLHDKVGEDYSTIVQGPPAYDNPALVPMSWDDAYFWGFEAVKQITEANPNHLYILDGFPHPDHWAMTRERWDILHTNMEQRLRALNTHQIILVPARWKEWEGRAIHDYMIDSQIAHSVRNRYEEFKSKTKLISAFVPVDELTVERVDSLLKGLGVEV